MSRKPGHGGELRAVATAATRSTERRAAPALLRDPQGRAAQARARRQARLDHRPAPRAGVQPRRSCPSASSTRRTAWRNSTRSRSWTEGEVWDYIRVARRAVQPALRPGLSLDRLRALHAPGAARTKTCARDAGGGSSADSERVRAARHARRTPGARQGARMSAVLREARVSLPARSHLDWLESEAIYILREVAGQCQNPVLLFSGGKDSIVPAAPGGEGLPARALSVPADAHRHGAQLSGGDRIPRPPRRRARRAAHRALGRGFDPPRHGTPALGEATAATPRSP